MSAGSAVQLMWGFEEAAGVAQPGQKASTMYGLRVKNLQFTPKPTFERVSNIDPRRQQLRGRVGKFELPFSFDSEMSVDDLARWRFQQQGFASIAATAAGVRTWSYRDLLSSDALTTAPDWITLEGDRDDGYAQLMLQGAVETMDIAVRANKIVSMKTTGMYCRFSHLKDPVYSNFAAATYTGTVYVRNNRFDADAQDTTNDLKFKATAGGALSGAAAKVSFTKGATAYGAADYFVTAGTWMPVILADGTYAGDPLDPVEVMFSAGGTFTTNDSGVIAAKRVKAAATYPSRNPLIAVAATVTIGGTVYPIEDFDIMHKRPLKTRRATSSKYPISLLPDGTRTFAIKLKRDYFDRDLYLKMLSSTSVSFNIVILGDLIATVASVSYYESYTLTSTNAQVVVAGADVPNDKQLPESAEIVPFWDGTNVDLTETIVCTLTSLK